MSTSVPITKFVLFKGETINYGSRGSNESVEGITQFWDLIFGGITQFKAPIIGGITGSKFEIHPKKKKKKFCGYATYLHLL